MSAEPVPPKGTTILREARPAPVHAVGPSPDTGQPRLVIVGCGALARELLALTAGIPGVRIEAVDA